MKKNTVYIVEKGNVFSAEIKDNDCSLVIQNQEHCPLEGGYCIVPDDRFYLCTDCWTKEYRNEVCSIPGYLECGEYVTFNKDDAERVAAEQRKPIKPLAVLSTTVLLVDGTYRVITVGPKSLDIRDVPHYVGHPATQEIVEALGAIPAQTKLFSGLQVGEVAVCFSIAQDKSTRAVDNFTCPHQEVTFKDLTCHLIRRVS